MIENLQEGDNTITVTATDKAGNTSDTATLIVTVKKKTMAELLPQTGFGER